MTKDFWRTDMDINEKAERAVELKKSMNCCQAVALALADETELDEKTLGDLGAGFGSGIGNTQGTCGALVGACMIAGLKIGAGAVRYTRQINESFEAACGATICKDLKGLTDKGVFCPCDECVKNAVLAYGKVMGI